MKLSKTNQARLSVIREMLRTSNITQRDIREKLDVHQPTACILINALVESGEAHVCGHLHRFPGKNPALVYALTNQPVAVKAEPTRVEQPSLWQRFKCWLAGNPYAGVSA